MTRRPRDPKPLTRWKSRIVGHGREAPDQLLAHPQNWRIHPQFQQDALVGVLDDVGWVQNIIVNKRTGHVLDGHLRVQLALRHDEPKVPVIYVDLSTDEERAILATLDPIAALAGADKEKLGELLEDVRGSERIAALLESVRATYKLPEQVVSGKTDPDDVPKLRRTSIKRGHLFELGQHRLLCGDSTKAEDVQRMVGRGNPSLMVTDPPYGVEYDPTWRDHCGGQFGDGKTVMRGKVQNDDRYDWTAAWMLFGGDVAYVWHGAKHTADVVVQLMAAGFESRSQIIWRKGHFIMSRGHYHWQHEPCWYVVKKGRTARWCGDRSQSAVWDIAGMNPAGGGREEKLGPGTQKPIECMRRPIHNHEGDVYDPFCGSGTTIVAGEQLDRRCYAIEISPAYCQVTVDRWEHFTGRKASKIGEVRQAKRRSA